ncbi:MFS transporter [Planctomyces sp. SH-PL62]|uniref:MFS transporter n=1 Tax=Planctomyces sp. SH-PL62 TaxID=1636152 RepID=UPI00078CFA37|nr:MFS transporter [Planctomyces sp. SH-PL62]AMV36637.1 Vacuole effluxer Atg22 like protein [Planctomyces sp. SH-PL62]
MSEDHRATREGDGGGLLRRLGLNRPELRAWAMYDWANSAMVCTIITAVFPIYYSEVACAGMDPKTASGRYAMATTLGMVIVAVMSPILGAYADQTASKKRLLGRFLALGLFATASMFFIHTGDWILASILFILANIGANASFVFYDALLPHIARDDEIDRVSTAGYALGYVGGGLLLALNLAWIRFPGWFGLPSGPGLTEAQATLPARLAFVSVAIWWLVFSIPLFRRVPEPPVSGGERWAGLHPVRASFGRLAETGRHLRRCRQGFLMLLAFLIYNDGIGTIIRMATIYGTELKINSTVMIASILLVQFVGIPCSFLFGSLAGTLGVKRSILLGLVVYTGICVIGYNMSTNRDFLILAVLVGVVQGGTQALSRSLFASLIPRSKSGEFFGFFAVVEKFAGIFGPAMFAIINMASGSSRGAILGVIGFFLVGGFLLLMVDVEEGQRLAKEWDLNDAAPTPLAATASPGA